MEDKKLSGGMEPKFSDVGKWFENFWYHYKFHTVVGIVAVITLTICISQMAMRDEHDFQILYAGPQVIALQDKAYMVDAVEAVAHDYNGDGKVVIAIDDIVMLSPEEQQSAADRGAALNGEFISASMTEYYQQIVGGDAVICLLSPYMYGIVREGDGFLPLSEIFDEIPESANDEYSISFMETEFARYFNGMNDLPQDTLICVRRLSTMAKFKGEERTRKAHEASIELFREMVLYDAPVSETTDALDITDDSLQTDIDIPGPINDDIPYNAVFVRADSSSDEAFTAFMKYSDNTKTLGISSVQHIMIAYFDGTERFGKFVEEISGYYQTNVSYNGELSFLDKVQVYDDGFFADNSLLILMLPESSGSIRHEVECVKGRIAPMVYARVNRIRPETYTADMADWFAFIEVSKEDVGSATEFDAWYN